MEATQSITCNTRVRLHSGRNATVSPRTTNTVTGWIVWLTPIEAKQMKLLGYSTGLYSYSVDLNGNVERWINGYAVKITTAQAPEVIG